MDSCGCGDAFEIFDQAGAEGDRERYRKHGPDETEMDRIAARHGLRPTVERRTWFWRVVVLAREAEPSQA
jgi:hypothetical protein